VKNAERGAVPVEADVDSVETSPNQNVTDAHRNTDEENEELEGRQRAVVADWVVWKAERDALDRRYERALFWQTVRAWVTTTAWVAGGAGLWLAGLSAILHVAATTDPAAALVGAVVFVGVVGLVLVFAVVRVAKAIMTVSQEQVALADDEHSTPPMGGIFR
jgi:xanthosine utilization system XapX-like protein